MLRPFEDRGHARSKHQNPPKCEISRNHSIQRRLVKNIKNMFPSFLATTHISEPDEPLFRLALSK